MAVIEISTATRNGTYNTLDGMRGVAAVLVAIHHFDDFFGHDAVPSGYLAVDLFFVLSGFVIANAYDKRFARGMTAWQFMLIRVVRLFPLYLLGTLLGVASAWTAWIFGQGGLSTAALVVATVTSLFMLPSPTWKEMMVLMPINIPGWSLFFEMVANLVYAVVWRHLSIKIVLIIMVASAGGLVLAMAQHGSGNVGPVWSTFFGGFPRVAFSFFAGVVMFMMLRNRDRRATWTAYLMPLALIVLFLVHPGSGPFRYLFDLVCVFVLFPLLVYAGIRSEPPAAQLFSFLGRISYPIYVLHFPVYLTATRGLGMLGVSPAAWHGIIMLGGLIVGSWALDRWFDQPIRRIIGQRVMRSPAF